MFVKRTFAVLLLCVLLLPTLASCNLVARDGTPGLTEESIEIADSTEAETEAPKPNPLENVAYIGSSGFDNEICVYFYVKNDPSLGEYYGYAFPGSKYFLVKYKGKKTYVQATYIDLRDSKNEIEHLIIAFQKDQKIGDLEKERLASCGIDYFFINSEIK